jgi:hypothetical protein
MQTMVDACATKPNITDGDFIEIKARDNDLFNTEVVSDDTETDSAPTATGESFKPPSPDLNPLQSRP